MCSSDLLQSVITAKVEQVATNIDNKDLLIQMKALEAAVANLALTKVIAEGTYQSGLITSSAATAITTLNTGVTTAQNNLNTIVTTATTNLNNVKNAALASFTSQTNDVLDQIDDLLAQLGSVNTNDIVTLVNNGLASITSAANTATSSITTARNNATATILQAQSDAVTIISTTGTGAISNLNTARDQALDSVSGSRTDALSAINTARDQAITAVTTSGNVSRQIAIIRDDRWLGLNIFAPNNLLTN